MSYSSVPRAMFGLSNLCTDHVFTECVVESVNEKWMSAGYIIFMHGHISKRFYIMSYCLYARLGVILASYQSLQQYIYIYTRTRCLCIRFDLTVPIACIRFVVTYPVPLSC